jgi:hypothetical protein
MTDTTNKAMTLDELRDICLQWLANVSCNGSNLPVAENHIRKLFDAHLATQHERETSVDDAGLTVRQVIETLVRERDAAVAALSPPRVEVTDEMLNAMLTARWKAINPHTDWVPDWDKRDRLGMRAAFEAALGEKS